MRLCLMWLYVLFWMELSQFSETLSHFPKGKCRNAKISHYQKAGHMRYKIESKEMVNGLSLWLWWSSEGEVKTTNKPKQKIRKSRQTPTNNKILEFNCINAISHLYQCLVLEPKISCFYINAHTRSILIHIIYHCLICNGWTYVAN